jgi:nicotinate-nucleotide adenylyltransferase
MDINELASLVRNRLPYKRFLHSLGVVKEARRLAVLWGADEEKAAVAALLHDITKPLSEAEQLQICRDAGIVLNTVERCEPKVLHAITGAVEAKKSYGIRDAEILSAIRYHTTGKAGMTLLDRVIYLADLSRRDAPSPGGLSARRHRPGYGGGVASGFGLFHPGGVGKRLHAPPRHH